MTKTAMRNAFRKLDATQQAEVLRELAEEHAYSLFELDRIDGETFDKRRHEEPIARPWSLVRKTIRPNRARRGSTRR